MGLPERSVGVQGLDLSPPPAVGTAEWWENMQYLGSGLGSGDATVSSFGVTGVCLPAGIKFEGTANGIPAWKEHFSTHAKQCGLHEAYIILYDIPV